MSDFARYVTGQQFLSVGVKFRPTDSRAIFALKLENRVLAGASNRRDLF